MLCKQQVSLSSNVRLCVNCIASPVLNFHWQSSWGLAALPYCQTHKKKIKTKPQTQTGKYTDYRQTHTNTHTNTHCLGAAGRPGSHHSAGQKSQSSSRKWLPLLHHLCTGSVQCKAGTWGARTLNSTAMRPAAFMQLGVLDAWSG